MESCSTCASRDTDYAPPKKLTPRVFGVIRFRLLPKSVEGDLPLPHLESILQMASYLGYDIERALRNAQAETDRQCKATGVKQIKIAIPSIEKHRAMLTVLDASTGGSFLEVFESELADLRTVL
jgi:hypothetical protein